MIDFKYILLKKFHLYFIRDLYNNIFKIRGKKNKITKNGSWCSAKIYIIGNNNSIIFKKGSYVSNIPIHIYGNNNYIEIGENVKIFNRHSFGDILCEGNNIRITIGNNTSIQSAHINAQENNSQIIIGDNCMISESVIIRTSDSHPIYDINTQLRINPPKDVRIGNHVWIAAQVCILKGSVLEENSIIGVGSIVTHRISANTIAAGVPAKTIKENINWNNNFPKL